MTDVSWRPELRIKTLETKVAALTQDFGRLVAMTNSRTEDLRKAHNALVAALKRNVDQNEEPSKPDCPSCGHGPEAVASSDEGTNYCAECEADARAIEEAKAEQGDKPAEAWEDVKARLGLGTKENRNG